MGYGTVVVQLYLFFQQWVMDCLVATVAAVAGIGRFWKLAHNRCN